MALSAAFGVLHFYINNWNRLKLFSFSKIFVDEGNF